MAYVRFYWGVAWEDANGKRFGMGDLLEPVILPAVDGEVFRKQVNVAASGTETLFDVDSDLADFDFCLIKSSKSNVVVEWTVDKNNGVGDEYATISLYADCPQPLGTNIAYANYTANFAGGTLDVIERIRVKNLGTETAVVELFAIT